MYLVYSEKCTRLVLGYLAIKQINVDVINYNQWIILSLLLIIISNTITNYDKIKWYQYHYYYVTILSITNP